MGTEASRKFFVSIKFYVCFDKKLTLLDFICPPVIIMPNMLQLGILITGGDRHSGQHQLVFHHSIFKLRSWSWSMVLVKFKIHGQKRTRADAIIQLLLVYSIIHSLIHSIEYYIMVTDGQTDGLSNGHIH